MIPRSFSTIVWDNNDFNEETVSGKETTHVANGIILQKKSNDTPLLPKKEVSKSVRSIKPPETDKPSLVSHKDELALDNNLQHQNDGRMFDFAYILAKLQSILDGVSLPNYGLHSTPRQIRPTQSTIVYLPVIDKERLVVYM